MAQILLPRDLDTGGNRELGRFTQITSDILNSLMLQERLFLVNNQTRTWTIGTGFIRTAAPTANDDVADGVLPGHIWVDTNTNKAYIAVDNSLGAAVWLEVLSSFTGQPLDATLTALAGLTITANSLTIGTGADAFVQTAFAANTFPARASTGDLEAKTISDFGLSLVDDASATAARSTLGLGTIATQNATNVSISGGTIAGPTIVAGANSLGVSDLTGDVLFFATAAISGNRTLTFNVDNASRVLTISDNTTLAGGTHSGTNTGDQTITLTGDVTGSGTGSFAATIADDAVTFAKMQELTAGKLIGRTDAFGGNPQEITPFAPLSISGTDLVVGSASTTTQGVIEIATAAEVAAATDPALAVTPQVLHHHPGVAKVWAYFTVSGGTVTVQASYGVSSITRSSAGVYVVNFSTALSSANYSVVAMAGNVSGVGNAVVNRSTQSTSSVQLIVTVPDLTTVADLTDCYVAIFAGSGGGGGGGGGGSGNVTSTGNFGSEPGSPSDGDLHFVDNGPLIERYNGSVWDAWGPTYPLTLPADGDFSWVNQGGASVTTTSGGIFLRAPVNSGPGLRCRVKSAPATPYTITALILSHCVRSGTLFQSAGLLFRNSGTGAIVTHSIANGSGGFSFKITQCNSPTSFSAHYLDGVEPPTRGRIWLRIADDGSNRICSYSLDGQNFITLHTVGRTDFLTADQVGFFANEQGNTYECGLTLLSWVEG